MKVFVMLFCFLISSFHSIAGAGIKGIFKFDKNQKISVEIREILPISSLATALSKKSTVTRNNSFSMKLKLKKAGFFQLLIITGEGNQRSQYFTTVFLTPKTKLNLIFLPKNSGSIQCQFEKIKDPNNRSLLAMQDQFNKLLNDNFSNPPANEKEVKIYLNKFLQLGDSLLAQPILKSIVKKYIQFKVADTYQSNLYLSMYNKNKQVANDFYNLPENMVGNYKDSFMLLFPSSVQNLVNYLNVQISLKPHTSRKTLVQIKNQLNLLENLKLKNSLDDKVVEYLLESYTNRYKVEENFEADKINFNKLTDYFANKETAKSIRESFSNLKYTLLGANLPPANFKDENDNAVNLDQFKGKYLFIDFWASWCAPCIKMTPYVQQLEKDYEGKNINFIAISIDNNKEAWLSKMKELNMHGHQFLDQHSDFSKNLNISAIPHYVIYDPAGKLLIYKTDMPDSPNLKKTLDALLLPKL